MKLFKKIKGNNTNNTNNECLEHGELPFGWVGRNHVFTDKIHNEYSYFLKLWIESQGTSNEIGSLKSLIMYIEDAKRLCDSTGECHSKWFTDCIADDSYLQKRKDDLERLMK